MANYETGSLYEKLLREEVLRQEKIRNNTLVIGLILVVIENLLIVFHKQKKENEG